MSVPMSCTKTASPRIPYTTDGTPARLRMLSRTTFVETVGGRVLLEVHGGRDAERHRDDGLTIASTSEPKIACDDAGPFGETRQCST